MIFNLAGMVSVAKLLSTCIDANRQGCEVIRDFWNQSPAAVSGALKEADDAKSVVTQADVDAQTKIVNGLRNAWGTNLKIIGEEDGECSESPSTSSDDQFLRTDILNDILSDVVPLEELTIFVDPLDGTREFVEGRVENVGCLVGIARNGRSLGGVVGVPFPNGKETTNKDDVVMHYALLQHDGDIVGIWPPQDMDQSNTKSATSVLTGDSSDPVLLNATDRAISIAATLDNAEKPNHCILGGTAAKLLSVAENKNSIAILHFKTSLWDTCATEALIHAKGGQMTDLFGYPLVHHEEKPEGNIFGVVASSGEPHMKQVHDELCSQMRGDTESVRKVFGKYMGNYRGEAINTPQALDVARDLDGAPLELSWLEKQIGNADHTASLKGYSVPESDAWRGLMSNGCRIMLDWDVKQGDSDSSSLPSSVFFKRVDMADSPDSRSKLTNAPHKLIRDVRSYQVETGFLTSDACQKGLIQEGGVLVNRVYGADLRPAKKGSALEAQIQSRFAMLVQDFRQEEGWEQEWLLSEQSAKATLEAFAKMHGYFWHGSSFWKEDGGRMGRELEHIVWPNGGYMQPALQGWDQLEKINAGWMARLPTFENDLKKVPELESVDLSKLGERLQKVAKAVGTKAHPFFYGTGTSDVQNCRTLIHGDPKQANIFLRQKKGSNVPNGELEVGLIDFQWCGFGLAATDIAHHICAAVQASCLSYCGSKEKELLDHYYACLTKSLVEHSVGSSIEDVQDNVFPRELLQKQYEIALLDICRMVFAYAWKRWKPESKPTLASLNRNAYNKSLPNVLWLVTRCSEVLSAHENTIA